MCKPYRDAKAMRWYEYRRIWAAIRSTRPGESGEDPNPMGATRHNDVGAIVRPSSTLKELASSLHYSLKRFKSVRSLPRALSCECTENLNPPKPKKAGNPTVS